MPPNYKLTKKAEQDLESILKYSYMNFGEKIAKKQYLSLKDCFKILTENPFLGRNADAIRKGYFRYEHANHTIFYMHKKTTIFIVRILGQNMDMMQHLSG